MTVFTYQELPFEVKSSAAAADFSGAIVIASAGVVSINNTLVVAGAATHSGGDTFSGAVVFTNTVGLQGTTSVGGVVTVGSTLSFSGALVCAMAVNVTVSNAAGVQNLIFSRRLLLTDGAGNAIYLYGGTSAQ